MSISRPTGVRGALATLLFTLSSFACDKDPGAASAGEAAAPPPATTATPAVEAPRAPDIVVDASRVSVGPNQVPSGTPGLADKIAVFLGGSPLIQGQTVTVVAMRNAKPSTVAATAAALEHAHATGASVHTEARDGTTQNLSLSFARTVPDCATVAWIAKDAAIDVWPAGGGTPKRVLHGLAGPDITLGTEAARKQAEGCNAGELVVGADDGLTWGSVFDLATAVLQAPGARASAAVLVTNAVRGRKLLRD
jgi:hypothetical protein